MEVVCSCCAGQTVDRYKRQHTKAYCWYSFDNNRNSRLSVPPQKNSSHSK